MFGSCFVIRYFVSFLFCDHLDREERASCFTSSVSCAVSALWLFLAMPWVSLQCVILYFMVKFTFL